MLERLDNHLHYTYSIWPSSRFVKKNVEMKFYEKPVYNYKLECENDPKRNMEAFNRELSDRVLPDAWIGMLANFHTIAVATLIVILVLPLVTA